MDEAIESEANGTAGPGNYSLLGAALSHAVSSVTTRLQSSSSTTPSAIVTGEPTSVAAASSTSLAYNSTVAAATTTTTRPSPTSTGFFNLTGRLGEALPRPAAGITTTGATSVSTASFATSTSTTELPFDEFGPPEGVEYIFVPLGVMIFVIVLSAVVIIISRKRKLERLRHRLMPLYNFDPGEEGEDDWETELLDEGFSSRQRRQGYQSMDSEDNTELFSPAHMQTLG